MKSAVIGSEVCMICLLASRGFIKLLSFIAWIPSWALGRRFEKGRSIDRSVCEEIVSFWSIALNNMNLF